MPAALSSINVLSQFVAMYNMECTLCEERAIAAKCVLIQPHVKHGMGTSIDPKQCRQHSTQTGAQSFGHAYHEENKRPLSRESER